MRILYITSSLGVPILPFLLALSQCWIVWGQGTEIERSCTELKQSIFEEKVGYGFLFPNAPIQYETIDNCHSYTPLIVGGRPAEAKEFPHMARLGARTLNPPNTEWFCGGTLISKRFVLTAAHCFDASQGEVNVVRLGDLDFDRDDDDAKPKDYAVEDYVKHPNYKDPQLYNDIGLIKLAEDVQFDSYKHPACLPFEDGSNFDSFIAVGWGSTNLAEKSSPKLLKVKLDHYRNDICRRVIESSEDFPRGFEIASQLCVGSDKPMDTCNGDSGGPILVIHKKFPCMYHVLGVTSVGISCGTPKIPSVYTRVYHYLDWIRETISKN